MYPPRRLRWSTSPDLGLSVFFFLKFLSEVIPQTFPSRLRRILFKYSKYCIYFISKCSYRRYLSTGISFRQLSFSMRISKSAIASIIKETICAIWTALQAQHMLSPTEEIFQETAKDFNIRIKRDKHDATCFIITLFSAQHVSGVNTSILRSLRLVR